MVIPSHNRAVVQDGSKCFTCCLDLLYTRQLLSYMAAVSAIVTMAPSHHRAVLQDGSTGTLCCLSLLHTHQLLLRLAAVKSRQSRQTRSGLSPPQCGLPQVTTAPPATATAPTVKASFTGCTMASMLSPSCTTSLTVHQGSGWPLKASLRNRRLSCRCALAFSSPTLDSEGNGAAATAWQAHIHPWRCLPEPKLERAAHGHRTISQIQGPWTKSCTSCNGKPPAAPTGPPLLVLGLLYPVPGFFAQNVGQKPVGVDPWFIQGNHPKAPFRPVDVNKNQEAEFRVSNSTVDDHHRTCERFRIACREQLVGVQQIQSTEKAFAAILDHGSVCGDSGTF